LTNEKGSRYGIDAIEPICRDCFVYESKVSLTYADKTEATPKTGSFVHHSVLMNLDKPRRIMECTSGPPELKMPSAFMAVAEESGDNQFRSNSGQIESGYYVGAKDRFIMFSELMNYKPEPQTVYITIEAEYVQGLPKDAYLARETTINIGACTEAGFIPDKNDYFKEGNWTVPVDGYVVQLSESSLIAC
jgi:hypothetical protein